MRNAFAIAALLVLFSTSAMAGGACATRSELNGLNVRALQTRLMVGAIACGQRKEYNNFVRKFKGDLKEYSQNMQSYFSRNYHESAVKEQDKFVTILANRMSGNNVTTNGRSEFCDGNSELFSETNTSSGSKLAEISDAAEISSTHGISPCANLAELSQ